MQQPARRHGYSEQKTSPRTNDTARTTVSTLKPHRHTLPLRLTIYWLNRELIIRALKPDASASPTVSRFLTTQLTLWPARSTKTLSWSSRLTVAKNFFNCWEYTDTMQPQRSLSHTNLLCTIRQIKAWHFKLIFLSLSSLPILLSITLFISVFGIDIFISPATVICYSTKTSHAPYC